MRIIAILLLLLIAAATVEAHEVRPAYLRIQQDAAERYDILWRVPARGEMRLGIYVGLPEHCRDLGEKLSWQEAGTHIEHWVVNCPGGHTTDRSGLPRRWARSSSSRRSSKRTRCAACSAWPIRAGRPTAV